VCHLRSGSILAFAILFSTALSLAATELTITISPSLSSARAGYDIIYTYLIENTGNTTISDITLNDSLLGEVTLNRTRLAPGMVAEGSRRYVVSESDLPGPMSGEARALGSGPDGLEMQSIASHSVGLSYSSGMRIYVHTERNSASVGDVVTYIYLVENTGDIILKNLSATDDLIGTVSLNQTTLLPGQAAAGEKSYTLSKRDLPGPLRNNVTVLADDPFGYVVSSTGHAALGIRKQPGATAAIEPAIKPHSNQSLPMNESRQAKLPSDVSSGNSGQQGRALV
jgi:uncharacterized repeat protein (TIGR01451 family)